MLDVSPAAACRIVGITRRQLDYWLRTGLVDAPVSGPFGFTHLRDLRAVKAEVDTGTSLRTIREARRD